MAALTLAFALTAMCVAADGGPPADAPPDLEQVAAEEEAPPIPHYSTWLRLVQCEATGNWSANTGNGYYGGLQADTSFWRRHGGLEYAPRADLATPTQQMLVAERGLVAQGWGAWPACSRRLGLR